MRQRQTSRHHATGWSRIWRSRLSGTGTWIIAAALALGACTGKDAAVSAGAGNSSGAATDSSGKKSSGDYQRARYDAIHFQPAIAKATDAQCLNCHQEVLKPSVKPTSSAGVKAADSLAWYQQMGTYKGDQETFHRRHMVTDYAKQVMPTMKCITCHTGNNPRDEAPNTSADTQGWDLRLRKQVDAGKVCLMCHGKMNWQVMGLPEPWEKSKTLFGNNCLTCHAAIRTSRHAVNFLNAQAIEEAGKGNADVCFGCHGGRAWYQTNFPYPRHAWPGMAPDVPEWAKDRPTTSDVRFMDGVMTAAAASAPAPVASAGAK